jgi:membrane fusion protein (multidrug efflux system)
MRSTSGHPSGLARAGLGTASARLAAVLLAATGWGALAATLAACGEQEAAERPAGVLVDTTTVVTQDVPRIVRAVGTVEAESQTVVKAEVDGQIARIVANEGDRVGEGDVVLQIDPTPFRLSHDQSMAATEQARAALANDEQLLERYDKLLAAGALDQQSYDDVAARVKSERAALAAAQSRAESSQWSLGKTSIRAPFAGTVAARKVELGGYVASGDDLFELVDAKPVRVAFDIAEENVGVLEAGDSVSFAVRTDPGKVYEGIVIYVSPSLDPQNRTQRIKAEYPNAQEEIKPGSFADLQVTASVRKNAPVIPEEALVSEGEQNFVYVIEEGKARKREVAVGERLDGRLEVATGLEGGEVVVVAGQRELRDDVPVRYAEAPAKAPGEVGPGKERSE